MSGSTDSIVTALTTQFQDQVHILAQQQNTKLRSRVLERPVKNANIFTYERIGTGEAIKVTERFSETIISDITHSRRQVAMTDVRKTLAFDTFDQLQMLIDPQMQYSNDITRALYREYDIMCLQAALASVATGRNGESTVTAAADGVSTVGDGSTYLNYDLCLQIRQSFIDSDTTMEVDEDIVVPITGKEWKSLMQEEELTSRLYVDEQPVPNGMFRSKRLGMMFVMFEGADTKYLPNASNIRTLPVFAKRGICAGVNKDITIEIDKRADRNNAWQVQGTLFAAALRTEGALVKKVLVKSN